MKRSSKTENGVMEGMTVSLSHMKYACASHPTW